MTATLIFLLLAQVSWAGPFQQKGLFDFMLEDEASGLDYEEAPVPPESKPRFTSDDFDMLLPEPVCPFRCQCHLRVVQCSDLGLDKVPKDLPHDTTLLDLQNNKITEIKDGDFKNLRHLHTLILVNNKISKISPAAFKPLVKLERLYLSKNKLQELPENMPNSLRELRAHENEITKLQKSALSQLNKTIVIELGTNPLKSSGIESGAFQDMSKLSYLRIADTNITTIPKGLPSSLTELHLDGNKITKVGASDLKGLINLAKLGLSFNSISVVDNGTLANVPHLRELHLDNNKLIRVPGGLADHKFLQVIYLHNNNITSVGRYDFCPPGYDIKKASYAGVSLFRNPVQRWNISRDAFRCVYMRSAIQFGNYK